MFPSCSVFTCSCSHPVHSIKHTVHITSVMLFFIFIFLVVSVGSTIFYHNLKVTAAGKGVLITGCDSKVSYGIARQLDDLGFTVFAGFQNKSDLSTKLKNESSGRLHVLQLNVTSEEEIQNALNYIKTHLPQGLWALINNVSWAAFGEVEWVPFEVFKQAAEINLLSAIRVTQVFLPLLRKTKGRVVNILSILGRISSHTKSPFCTVKFGLEAFSDCLRLEMRKWGVDVVVVEPGTATTGCWFDNKEILEQAKVMWKGLSDEIKNDYGEDYFEYKIRTMPEYNTPGDIDISAILRSLIDAVSRTFPLSRYTPVTRQEKIQALVADHLPRSVYDIIYT